ncbi:MAG: hypothetical protein ACYC7A_12310 [Thermoanaerobaculia bacterium]
MTRSLSHALFFVALLLPTVVSAEAVRTSVSVVCVDGENCSWLEPLGERLAKKLFLDSKLAPLELNGHDVVRACRKGMSPEEADACVRDAVRAAAPGLGATPNRVVLHFWTENGEVVRGSAQIVQAGKAETALFTLVPVDASKSLRAGFGTPAGNSHFALRGGLGTVAAQRGLAAPVERIPIQVLPEVRIFGELVLDPPPVR